MMSELALRYVQTPLNRGPLEGATQYGESDPPGEGPYVQIWLVVEGGLITKANYKSPGCPSSSACGGVLCALVTGRGVDTVALIDSHDLVTVVGELPEGKGHYADRAVKALRVALGLLS